MWKLISAYFVSWLAAVTGIPASDISWRMFFLRNNRRQTTLPLLDPYASQRTDRRKIFARAAIAGTVAVGLYALSWGYRYWTVTLTINDIWLEQNISEKVSKQLTDAGKLPPADVFFDEAVRPEYLDKYGIGPMKTFLDSAGYFSPSGTNWELWWFPTKVAAVLWLAPPKVKPDPFRIWKEVEIVDEYYARNSASANLVAVVAGAEAASAEVKQSSHFITLAFAIAGLLTGIIAALIWSDSARVEIPAPYEPGGIPPGPEVENVGWTVGIMQAYSEASRLSKKAAIWTALSVVLNGIAAVLGALSW